MFGDFEAGGSHRFGKQADAHDLGAQPPGQPGGHQQPFGGKLGAMGLHLLRGYAQSDEPPLGFHAGR